MDFKRLIIVSNRLPVILTEKPDATVEITPASGGMVTALEPVLKERNGVWIGWSGTFGTLDLHLEENDNNPLGYSMKLVPLTPKEIKEYYYGFSNEILWPLFHDLPSRCRFEPTYWKAYQSVNTKFAKVVTETTKPEDYIWVQDYQLLLVAQEMSHMGVKRRTGFFLHIPFPPLDVFLKLPWRRELIEGMLSFDLLGFQTVRDQRNFIDCIHALVRTARVSGRGYDKAIVWKNRTIQLGVFPISIDFTGFVKEASAQNVAEKAWLIHEQFPKKQLILSVDRLDYTKGIPNHLLAFQDALERYEPLRGKAIFFQVAVPSRTEVPEYQALREEIEGLVGRINGQFTIPGWTPIHYINRSLEKEELLAYYRTSEIALVTPLKDGMNLVSKEFCTCSLEENSVLILSEFAGAASQLHRHALMVNPFHIEGIADAIFQAFQMPQAERRERMHALRRSVRRQDVFRWMRSFLNAAFGREETQALDLRFPPVQMYKDHR